MRYTGVSNFSGWQVAKTVATAREHRLIAPVAQQVYYTPEARGAEYEILPAAADGGLGTLVWSPPGQGLLTGKVRRPSCPGRRPVRAPTGPELHVVDRNRGMTSSRSSPRSRRSARSRCRRSCSA